MVDVFPPHQQPQIRSQLAAALVGVISQRLLQRADGQGRVAAFEVVVATAAIRTMIRDNKMHQAQSVMESSHRDGMVTLDNALRALLDEELISRDEGLRFVRNPAVLVRP